MIVIAKNTTISGITIPDLAGVTISGGDSVALSDMFELYEISSSEDILPYISTVDIVINDGDKDLSVSDGIKYITAYNTIQGPKDRSGKIRVHQTSRALGTSTCWTGIGDDPSDPVCVGGGQSLFFEHTISGSVSEVYYVDFNVVENITWIHEGYITWHSAMGDTITAEIVPRVTDIVSSSGTDYNLYGGYLIVPAAPGTGNIEIVSSITTHSGGLVYTPLNDEGIRPTAYWDADWNTSTKRYENISPNYAGTGKYNMFAAEISFVKFFNLIPLLGDGFEKFQSSDSDELGHGMRMKLTIETNLPNHAWSAACVMTLHRESSV